jgi:hypothetical protein
VERTERNFAGASGRQRPEFPVAGEVDKVERVHRHRLIETPKLVRRNLIEQAGPADAGLSGAFAVGVRKLLARLLGFFCQRRKIRSVQDVVMLCIADGLLSSRS